VHVLHASLKYMGYTTEKFMGYTTDKFMGYTTDKFNKHSFWIGAATYLSKLGYSDEEIQKRGQFERCMLNMHKLFPC
jgi:hypothetical protein